MTFEREWKDEEIVDLMKAEAPEDRNIIDAAVAYVKAHRRWEIAAATDAKDHEKYHEKVRDRSNDLIAAVDKKYKPKDDEGLVPPDINQCQSMIKDGSFMTLGPRKHVRCKEKPVVIATENKPGPDGKIGSMSLCDHCAKMFKEKLGEDYATFTPIKEKSCESS